MFGCLGVGGERYGEYLGWKGDDCAGGNVRWLCVNLGIATLARGKYWGNGGKWTKSGGCKWGKYANYGRFCFLFLFELLRWCVNLYGIFYYEYWLRMRTGYT